MPFTLEPHAQRGLRAAYVSLLVILFCACVVIYGSWLWFDGIARTIGYDGIIYALGRRNSQIGENGGAFYKLFAMSFLMLILASSITIGWTLGTPGRQQTEGRPPLLRTCLALSFPISLLCYAAIFALIDKLGIYESVLFHDGPPLYHKGRPVEPQRWWLCLGLFAAIAYATTLTVRQLRNISLVYILIPIIATVMFCGAIAFDNKMNRALAPVFATFFNLSAAVVGVWFFYVNLTRWIINANCAAKPPTGHCDACGYDLRGTIAAGRRACPECGEAFEVETLPQTR